MGFGDRKLNVIIRKCLLWCDVIMFMLMFSIDEGVYYNNFYYWGYKVWSENLGELVEKLSNVKGIFLGELFFL